MKQYSFQIISDTPDKTSSVVLFSCEFNTANNNYDQAGQMADEILEVWKRANLLNTAEQSAVSRTEIKPKDFTPIK